jgi:hypothetical protein
MKVTYHAAQRFLERVIKKTEFTKDEVHKTVKYLEKALKDVMVYSYKDFLPLPGFENEFCIVAQEHNAITIIPKDKKEFRSRHYVTREQNILHKTIQGVTNV